MQIQFEISREELHVIYIFYVLQNASYTRDIDVEVARSNDCLGVVSGTFPSEKTLFLSGPHYSGLGNLG